MVEEAKDDAITHRVELESRDSEVVVALSSSSFPLDYFLSLSNASCTLPDQPH